MRTSCQFKSEKKSIILQKWALRLMYFSDRRIHAIPLFVRFGVLPLNMLYFKYSATLMHDISNNRAPSNISELFVRSNMIHSHYTRFCASGNFYVQRSRLNQLLLSFSSSGVRIWNKIPLTLREQHKDPFKRKLHKLLIKVLEWLLWVPLPVPTWTRFFPDFIEDNYCIVAHLE